ncbi:putative ORfan [Saudi moumouvirus]|nr:putative ORfan [Saudi moumouvirus]
MPTGLQKFMYDNTYLDCNGLFNEEDYYNEQDEEIQYENLLTKTCDIYNGRNKTRPLSRSD